MKRVLFFAGLILIPTLLASQTGNVQPVHTVSLKFIGGGYSYEHPLSNKIAINAELMMTGGFGSNFIFGSYWIFAPVLRAEPRYYYNLTKRFEKTKNTKHNSADFLSLAFDYQLPISIGSENVESVSALTIAPMWGYKRTLFSLMIVEIAIGPGLTFAEKSLDVNPILKLDLKLGFAFQKSN